MDFNKLIEQSSSHDLQDLHMLIFKQKVSESQVKTNLKEFRGFKDKDFQKHVDFATTNFDSDELAAVCLQLSITAIENIQEDAVKIVKALTVTEKSMDSGDIQTQVFPHTPQSSNGQMQFSVDQQSSQNTIGSNSRMQFSSSGLVSSVKSTISIQEQLLTVHNLKKQILDLEEQQIIMDPNSAEFSIIQKRITLLEKRVSLEETFKLELIEERKLNDLHVNHNSNSNFVTHHNQDLRQALLKTPQNLKLSNFNGKSYLDWHYFKIKYYSSTQKYNLTKEENLIRLNEHITDEARQKVDLLLKSSKDPSFIMNILDSQYGGEDRVLKDILSTADKIKKVSSLEDFKEFNLTLQNVSSVISQMDEKFIDIQRLLSKFSSKLPDHLVSQWANFLISQKLKLREIEFTVFTDWIHEMSQIVSEVTFYHSVREANYEPSTSQKNKSANVNDEKTVKRKNDQNPQPHSSSNKTCKLCKQEEHPLTKCPNFQALDANKRFTTVKKLNYCIFCLNKHFGFCRKRKQCTINECTRFHHELLHESEKPKDFSGFIKSNSVVLLKMLPVKLKFNNTITKAVAFLDDGSTLSLIENNVAEKMGFDGKPEGIHFQWTNDIYREDSTSRNITLEICGENSEHFYKIDNVHTVNDLQLPRQGIDLPKLIKSFPELQNMSISSSYNETPVLLLGQPHASLITNRHTIEIPNGGPFLSRTKLGWAIHGPIQVAGKSIGSFVGYLTNEDDSLEEAVANQFKLENFDMYPKVDGDKEKAVDILQKSITKCNDHYEVSLPWKESVEKLPNSIPIAKQRLLYLEKKLLKDEALLVSYRDQINKLLEKGYARKIKFSDLQGRSKFWVLPHFPVFNPKKPQKPARIVFDAAAKVDKQCLNDFLNPGPDWLCSIISILIRFRQHRIAFTGDIQEMFNRVKIHEDDTFAQCFLWRNVETKKPIQIYQMKAMLFGLNCAPFIAQFVKNHNATQKKDQFPEAYKAIIENHYVDDYVDGCDNLNEAGKLVNDVIQVHRCGGFHIRSFISNDHELIKKIPRELVSDDMFTNKSENIQKVLGLFWDVQSDNFHFLFNFCKINAEILNGKKIPTKKEVLQTLMTIYDPLGFLTPITIKAKILMQLIWKSKINWNVTIPEEFRKKWKSFTEDVNEFKNLQVPRPYKIQIQAPQDSQLHIFCDASADSYCAVAYLRLSENSRREISFIFSKSRVAPIKNNTLTIPKLELMGAVLGVRIANLINENLKVTKTYYWTDSMVVLAWIDSKKYLKTFERNRVNEILKYSDKTTWNWIPTQENVADMGTRDNSKDFTNQSRWFKGPSFLSNDNVDWKEYFKISEEAKQKFSRSQNIVMVISENTFIRRNLILPDVTQYNELFRLLRVTAWELRYFENLRAKVQNQVLNTRFFHSVTEIENAENVWVKKVQQECFKHDIDKIFQISNGSHSRLSKYKYKLDEKNILRLQGRAKSNQYLSYDVVNPKILDGDHKFTKLLILDIHYKNQHFGNQVVIHEFRSKYWMPKMSYKIKNALKLCLHCRLRAPDELNPSIGNLIKERFRFLEKSFTVVGIDYFGPYYVKVGRKLQPRYGVLFTCLTTRAVHIEISRTLTTDSCLMAIRRAQARRGQIKLIISDNATNFKGASRELLECIELLHPYEIESQLVKFGIEWKFIPPQTPHFGGCWERMIGCFKSALTAVLPKNRNVDDEMLQTIFAETEYIMNTRPYILESDDFEDSPSLTPMDILIPKFIEVDSIFKADVIPIHKRRWRICQELVDSFWNRFIKEYVPSILNTKLKSISTTVQVKAGDLVYIKNRIDRGKWPIGKVSDVHPGQDGQIRVVDVVFNKKNEKMSVRNLLKINFENLI